MVSGTGVYIDAKSGKEYPVIVIDEKAENMCVDDVEDIEIELTPQAETQSGASFGFGEKSVGNFVAYNKD